MRKLIIFTVTILFPTIVFAQLSQLYIVGKPEKSETEIVGVRDASGNFCAAIQVISDKEGYTYDSYNGVVKVGDEPGKDMVFLSADERVLEIYRTGYEPLKIILSEIGIQLEPRNVWIIRIAGEMPLIIESYPKEAEVFLDSTYLGKTPYRGKIKRGTFELMLKKDLYHDFAQTVKVTSDTTVKYVFDMMPKFGSFVLTTEPNRAEVFLDGNLRGKTPVIMERIISGEHNLTVRHKPNYKDVRRTITIKDGEELKDNIILPMTEQGLFMKRRGTWVKRRNWTLIGTGTLALAGLGCKLLADDYFNKYNNATSTDRAVDLRKKVENLDLFTIISFSASSVFLGWSTYNHFKIPKTNVKVSLGVTSSQLVASFAF